MNKQKGFAIVSVLLMTLLVTSIGIILINNAIQQQELHKQKIRQHAVNIQLERYQQKVLSYLKITYKKNNQKYITNVCNEKLHNTSEICTDNNKHVLIAVSDKKVVALMVVTENQAISDKCLDTQAVEVFTNKEKLYQSFNIKVQNIKSCLHAKKTRYAYKLVKVYTQ